MEQSLRFGWLGWPNPLKEMGLGFRVWGSGFYDPLKPKKGMNKSAKYPATWIALSASRQQWVCLLEFLSSLVACVVPLFLSLSVSVYVSVSVSSSFSLCLSLSLALSLSLSLSFRFAPCREGYISPGSLTVVVLWGVHMVPYLVQRVLKYRPLLLQAHQSLGRVRVHLAPKNKHLPPQVPLAPPRWKTTEHHAILVKARGQAYLNLSWPLKSLRLAYSQIRSSCSSPRGKACNNPRVCLGLRFRPKP